MPRKNFIVAIVAILLIFELMFLAYTFGRQSEFGPATPASAAAVPANAVEPAASARSATFDIEMNDSFYGFSDTNVVAPPVWTVPTGADVILNFNNTGHLQHDWAVVKEGASIPVPYNGGADGLVLQSVGMVYSQSKSTVTMKAPAPGTYIVMCTVSGHYPFMQGRLVVTEK